MKKSSSEFNFSIKGLLLNPTLVAGILFYALSTILMVPAYRFGQLSVLYPLLALSYVWVTFLGTKYLGEKLNMAKLVGVIFIIGGVFFIGLSI